MTEKYAEEIMQMALNKIEQNDLMHRGFLKPIEIALKTSKTEFDQKGQTNLQSSNLPTGLKIIYKYQMDSNKFEYQDVVEVNEEASFEELVENKQDNLLSLMKQKEGIKLGICICMYSESRQDLKKTLAGVEKNIANLVAFGGTGETEENKLNPDDIGVFVIIDGIEKVNKSVVDYYQELQRRSGIDFGHNFDDPVLYENRRRQYQEMDEKQINEIDLKYKNDILFNPVELQVLQNSRFISVHKKYMEMKELLLQVIPLLKKNNLQYTNLPNNLKSFFENEAIRKRKQDYSETDEDISKLDPKFIQTNIFEYYQKDKSVIYRTLAQAKKYATEYLNNRQGLAHLSHFRTKIQLPENKESIRLKITRNSFQTSQTIGIHTF